MHIIRNIYAKIKRNRDILNMKNYINIAGASMFIIHPLRKRNVVLCEKIKGVEGT